MKKTILFLLVAATFVFSACGTQKTSEAASTNTKTNLASEQQIKDSATEKVQEQATAEVDTTTSVGDNVTIHFPASLMNNDTSSKGLSTVLSAIDALGYKYTSVDNADGSRTLTMSKKDNEAVMKFISDSTLAQLKSAYVSDSYPNFKDFSINGTYDAIDISTTATSENDLTDSEKGALTMIESTGLILEIFHGVSGEDLNFTVNLINSSTNQTVYSEETKNNTTFDILK